MIKNDVMGGMDQSCLMSGVVGGVLVLMGLKKCGVFGLLMIVGGGYFVYKVVIGKDFVMEVVGLMGLVGVVKLIFVEYLIVIDCFVQQVYDYWCKLENLFQIMSYFESVMVFDDKCSCWVVKVLLGIYVEWEVEVVNDKFGECIGWYSFFGVIVDNVGSVQFESLFDDKICVYVVLSYCLFVGFFGVVVVKLFGEEFSQQIVEDFQKFKVIFEGVNFCV